MDNLSKKEIKNGNKGNLYEIKDELIIIDNENPKDNIFNTIVEEIYTNKQSTKTLDFQIKKWLIVVLKISKFYYICI